MLVDSFVIFRGSGQVLLRNPIVLEFLGVGVRTPVSPPGSAHGFVCD